MLISQIFKRILILLFNIIRNTHKKTLQNEKKKKTSAKQGFSDVMA